MVTDSMKSKRNKLFVVVLVVMFALASLSSVYTEIFERKINITDNEIKYEEFDSSTNEYIFIDKNQNDILFKGDYNDNKSVKSMIYNGSFYQLRVNTDFLYDFYKDDEVIDVLTPFEIKGSLLKGRNEDVFLLIEAFRIISIVENKIIYKLLIIQFVFIIIASIMFADPKYFWQIGYFKRHNTKEPTNIALKIIRLESIFIALIIISFPLVRLIG